jgi:glycine/D-amino acid oxidase-like deaminating enzyme/nitrite reductase/ring-hydroxylating ferredoxin subunit
MSERRAGASYWMKSTEAPAYPELTGDVTVDVAVIGAGIAGLSTAWELARQGRRVALVDAAGIASGVSGHTTAKVSSLHGAVYGHLASRLGTDTAAAYATSQQLAMRHVAEVAEMLGIDCDLETRPAYLYTESDDDVDQIKGEAEAAATAGLPATFTTDAGLPFPVSGAVRVDDQLMFHPRKYLLGLAADLTARGGRIFERTRVTELDEGEPSNLTTAGGQRITATDVVVATHYPIFDRALLFARLVPRREFAVTSVVAADDDPPGMYISNAQDTRSVRSTPYDGRRLLIATGAPFTPGDTSAAEHVAALTSWMRNRFGVEDVVHTWAAQDNHTSDGVPFIGPLHPMAKRTWVATGFGGWGMTNGVLSGILLAELMAGREPPYASIYHPRRFHPTVETKPLLKAQASVASHWAGSRLRARLPGVGGVREIPPGQAGLISDGDGHWATYVDEDGLAHQVSATCTHMGCLVAFNQVEREWECPCHGSRFGLDGTVVQGPATKRLKPRPAGP